MTTIICLCAQGDTFARQRDVCEDIGDVFDDREMSADDKEMSVTADHRLWRLVDVRCRLVDDLQEFCECF
jgi:hypothetical protein